MAPRLTRRTGPIGPATPRGCRRRHRLIPGALPCGAVTVPSTFGAVGAETGLAAVLFAACAPPRSPINLGQSQYTDGAHIFVNKSSPEAMSGGDEHDDHQTSLNDANNVLIQTGPIACCDFIVAVTAKLIFSINRQRSWSSSRSPSAVAAAAVIVEGSSDPGSPLSPHSQFLRDRTSSSGVGLGPSDSDADEPPPHDFSRDLAPPMGDKRGGMLRGGHHHHHHRPPPNAGSTDLALDGPNEEGRPWPGSRSFDGRFPPSPPGAGNGEVPPFPDHGPLRKGHPKNFGNKKPGNWGPPPPPPGVDRPMNKGVRGHNDNKRQGHDDLGGPFAMDREDKDVPPLGSGVSGSTGEHFPPQSDAGGDFAPPFPWQDRGGDARDDRTPGGINLPPPRRLGSPMQMPPKQSNGKPSKPNMPDGKQPPFPDPRGADPDVNKFMDEDDANKPDEVNPVQTPKAGSGSSEHDSNAGNTAAPPLIDNSQ
ncbi:hypothetical protein ON010_g245 [Phytophthora cinnamomi]|nr:hypothetical protein ON010_g245 [Phytophthora cinnamomi]